MTHKCLVDAWALTGLSAKFKPILSHDDKDIIVQGHCLENGYDGHTFNSDVLSVKYLKNVVGLLTFLLFLVQGHTIIRPFVRTALLFKAHKRVRIVWSLDHMPTSAYISCHHRRPSNETDLTSVFFLEPFFKTYLLVTAIHPESLGRGLVFKAFTYVADYVINNINLLLYDTADERHWLLVKDMISNDSCAVAVVPDKDGSQYYGDRTMNFRTGLFAASAYTQKPILDVVILEATASNPETVVIISKWDPPVVSRAHDSSVQYALWRAQNKDLIEDYTIKCQKSFFRTLDKYEKGSCLLNDQLEVCPINPKIDKSIRRNKSAALNR